MPLYTFLPRGLSYPYRYIPFSFLLIYGGLGVGALGLGSWIGFSGLGFSVDGVWGLWCWAFMVLWDWWSQYKHRRINLGKKIASQLYNGLYVVTIYLTGSNLKLRLGHWQSLNSGFALVVHDNFISQVDI